MCQQNNVKTLYTVYTKPCTQIYVVNLKLYFNNVKHMIYI